VGLVIFNTLLAENATTVQEKINTQVKTKDNASGGYIGNADQLPER
jgi:hypothetical protein